MSLIGWIIIAMIVVAVIAVIVLVWCSKLYREIYDYPVAIIPVVASLVAIALGCMQLTFARTVDDVVGNTVLVIIIGAVAIVYLLVQLRACWETHCWQRTQDHY